MILVIFRFTVNPDSDLEELGALNEKMGGLVSQMPGFLGVKDFAAQDGEMVVVAEFDSLESVDEWKAHPEHVAAQKAGRESFFASYQLQVCELIRSQEFTA